VTVSTQVAPTSTMFDTKSRGYGIRFELIVCAVIIIAIVASPLFQGTYWQGVIVVSLYYALLAQAWNLLAGYTGLFSLAPAAFGMIGAYITGMLYLHLGTTPVLGIAAATLGSGVVGASLAACVMRLSGPYLALMTLAFSEIVRLVLTNAYSLTRGDLGIQVTVLVADRSLNVILFAAVSAAILVGIAMLMSSKAGLYFRAIRDDEIGARARGVDTPFWKTLAFAISAAISGLAGALYAHFAGLVTPELGLPIQNGLVIAMVVIGGMGSLAGPLIGALIVWGMAEALRGFGGAHFLIFAILMIVFVRFIPAGVWGLFVNFVRQRSGPAK
jgi:branched-chain amino acid transport system permease protein